ncbi:MAG: hypothetical protein ABI127_01280 [Dokdonella sp.]
MYRGCVVKSAYERHVKAAILIGIPFFFMMGAITLYLLLAGDDAVVAKMIFAAVGGLSIAFALIGARLLPYVFSTIAVGPDGLRIVGRSSDVVFHPWNRISHFTDRQALQVLDVYGKDGARLLSVDYMIDNFDGLQRKLTEQVSASR